MRLVRRLTVTGLAAAAAVAASGATAVAERAAARTAGTPIVYIEHMVATGTLGTTHFTNAGVTVSFRGNTSTVSSAEQGEPTNSTGTATVHIEGVGSGTITGSPYVFDNQNQNVQPNPSFGIARGGAYLSLQNAALASYGLTTQFGPVSGPVSFRWSFPTTSGTFTLTSAGTGTFLARFTS